MVGHPIIKCRDIMETIQDLFNKGEIKYETSATPKAAAANIMMVSHSDASLKLEERKGDKEGKAKGVEVKPDEELPAHEKKR